MWHACCHPWLWQCLWSRLALQKLREQLQRQLEAELTRRWQEDLSWLRHLPEELQLQLQRWQDQLGRLLLQLVAVVL